MSYDDMKGIQGEDNDCTVKAVALVLGISYATAHRALSTVGRANRAGTALANVEAALRALGHRVRRRYSGRRLALELGQRAVPTTADPMLKPERWANMPDLLLHVNNHIAAFVDGKVEDWSRSNKVSIYEAWELERIGLTEHRREELPPVIYL